MALPFTIAIIPTVQPVGPWRARLEEQFFSLNLSIGVPLDGPAVDKKLPATEKMPWEWLADSDDRFVVIAQHKTDVAKYGFFGVRLSAEKATPHFNVGTGDANLTRVKKEWINRNADASWSQDFIGAEGRTEATLPEQLAYLSTFPGDLPQLLGIVKYMRLRPLTAGEPGHAISDFTDLESIGSFIVAPKIIDENGNVDAPPQAAPADLFHFNEKDNVSGKIRFTQGWPYQSGKRAAFVKPLRVRPAAAAGKPLNFHDDNAHMPARMNFGTYLLEVERAEPWTDELERRCAELFNAFVRLSEAEPPPLPPKADETQTKLKQTFDASLEQLRLKALAFNGQWKRPGDPVVVGQEERDADRLISELVLIFGPEFEVPIREKLVSLHNSLTDATDEKGKNLWLDILSKNLNTAREPQQIFAKFHETRELLQLVLFFQWSLLFQFPEVSDGKFFIADLAKKWESFPEDEGAENASVSKKRVRGLFEAFVRRQQREKAERFLGDIFAATTAPDQLSAKIVEGAKDRLSNLCKELSTNTPLPAVGVNTDVCQNAVWTTYVADFTQRLSELLSTELKTIERESKPSGLTIQLDDPAHETQAAGDADAAADTDVWRKLAGVGVMIREKGKPWRIVSAANIHEKHSAEDGHRPGFFDKPAVVPVRIPFRSGVRYPFITYNQRSLIAESPLARAAVRDGSFTLQQVKELTPEESVDSQYEYKAVLQPEFNLLKLKRLRFGKEYDAAAFMLDTAGGLPDILTSTVQESGKTVNIPWKFDYSKWEGQPAPAQNIAELPLAQFKYLRRVPVGQVRVAPRREGRDGWPEPLPGVFPLAKEIESAQTLKGQAGAGEKEKVEATPLALLYESQRQTNLINLKLTLPTVDVDVLERSAPESWFVVSAGGDQKSHFERVLDDYFNRLTRRNDPSVTSSKTAEDISFDDPAVGSLLITLERYEFDPAKGSPHWSLVSFQQATPPAVNPASGIEGHQWSGVNVLCERGDPKNNEFAFVEAPEIGGYKITVPSDHVNVARVKVYALVDKGLTGSAAGGTQAFPLDFFRSNAANPAEGEDAGGELMKEHTDIATKFPALKSIIDKSHLLRPFQILLETPTTEMPVSAELWKQLRVIKITDRETWNKAHKTKAKDRDSVAVCLVTQPELLGTDQKRQFRNVITCDVLKQTWRWQGRPVDTTKEVAPWLFDEKPDGDQGEVFEDKQPRLEKVLGWEVGAFAEIDDLFDTLTIPVNYTLNNQTLLPENEPLYIDGFDKDLRAYYVRYAVRAHSRYKGLFEQLAVPVTSRQEIKLNGGAGVMLTGTGWRRAFVPYRGPKPPKPTIKAIVPMSKVSDQKEGVSSLMVVLDEAMFSFCGITEAIECEVELAQLPKDGLPKELSDFSLFQVGPDPLLSEKTYKEKFKKEPGQEPRLILSCQDPFGYTFDTDARQPLFSSSSLILSPQYQTSGAAKGSLAGWDLARIRFRRVSQAVPPSDIAARGAEEEWTKPVWVQFLPAASFGLDFEGTVIQTEKPGGKRAFELKVLSQNPFGEDKFFKYWLLLTSTVTDFRGLKEREQYVASVPAKVSVVGSTAAIEFQPPADLQDKNLKCRLLEVQVPPKETQDTDLWKDLLGLDADSNDAKARITRISPVIVMATG